MAALLLLAACSKDNDESSQLEGTWEWLGTAGGLANHIHDTPASTGKNIDLRLTRDKKYFVYTNGVITSQGSFQLGKEVCIHNGSEKTVLLFSPGFTHEKMIESLNAGRLELNSNSPDGTGSSYRRK